MLRLQARSTAGVSSYISQSPHQLRIQPCVFWEAWKKSDCTETQTGRLFSSLDVTLGFNKPNTPLCHKLPVQLSASHSVSLSWFPTCDGNYSISPTWADSKCCEVKIIKYCLAFICYGDGGPDKYLIQIKYQEEFSTLLSSWPSHANIWDLALPAHLEGFFFCVFFINLFILGLLGGHIFKLLLTTMRARYILSLYSEDWLQHLGL